MRTLVAGELVRWTGAMTGALLMHGALWLGQPTAPPVTDVNANAPLVWLETVAAPERRDAAPELAATTPVRSIVMPPAVARPRPTRARTAKPLPEIAAETARETEGEGAVADWTDAAPARADTTAAAGDIPGAGAAVNGESGHVGSALGDKASSVALRAPIHPPNLLSHGDPCRGFYPASANANHGEVRVVVNVERDGLAHDSKVIAEIPSRQGFASAARACLSRLRFRPARDATGGAVPGRAVLALSFDRRG